MGRSTPCPLKSVGFFFLFIDLFYLLFERFGFFSLDTSPLFKVPRKGSRFGKKKKNTAKLFANFIVLKHID